MSRMYPDEDPGVSPQKKNRTPQMRDYQALSFARKGGDGGLGSGRSWERATFTAKRITTLREEGRTKEAALLEDAIHTSVRGSWEIARLPEEAFSVLCQWVEAGNAPNLVVARRWIQEMARKGLYDGISAAKQVTVARCKNDMYRITSLHNHSSVLVSAKNLIELSALLLSIMPELQEKAGEDPGSSEE